MTTTTNEDSRPTHPRTVTTESGRTYRLVLSPRAMRTITAARLSNETIATHCQEVKDGISRDTLRDILAPYLPEHGGWSDYADAVAAATEVGSTK